MVIFVHLFRLALEIALLIFMITEEIYELPELAVLLIMLRLFVGFVGRLQRIPYLFDEFENIIWGIIICLVKIGLEIGTSISIVKSKDIDVSTYSLLIILGLMTFRNVSDAVSLAMELEEL